jgi:hypothetical protein
VALLPPVIVSPLMLTPVALGPTVKTVAALLPLTVSKFVNVAPLPEVGPAMLVFVGTVSVPLVSVIVCAVLNTDGEKVMLPAPADAALLNASRSDPVPESFVFVTTKLGTALIVSVKLC